MKYKSAAGIISIFVTVVAGACLQGCNRTPSPIDRALVIGITTNRDKDNSALPNAAADARDFGETLSSSAKLSSQYLRVVTAKDEQMTRGNLLNELRQFAGQTSKNDVAWLMIEGQGIEIDGENYFYVEDSQQKNGKPLKETVIGMQDILQALKGMQAKELIITLAQNTDSSESNPLDYPVILDTRLSGDQMDSNWKMPAGVRSMVTFTFSGLEQKNSGGPLINPFTYYIAEGLNGGAADQEGTVKLMNLLRYVQLGVASNIQLFGGNIKRCAWSIDAKNKTKALNAILANKLSPGLGGKTAVSLSQHPQVKEKCSAAMLRAFELQMEIEQNMIDSGKIANAVKSHTLIPVMRTSLAPVKNQFLKALYYDPNFLLAYYNLGILEAKLDDWGDAQKYFQKAMDIDPQSPILIWRMALLMQRQKKYQEAENYYKKAIVLTSNNDIIRYDLARLYIDAHEFDKAKKLLKEIIKKNPMWSAPLNTLSSLYYISGDETKTMELLQQAYALDPNNTDVLDKLAWNYCHKIKDYQKSEQLYRKLVKLSPSACDYRRGFAECLLQEGKTDEAKLQAKKAIDLGCSPNDPLFKKLKIN